jgi:hypothetical protein
LVFEIVEYGLETVLAVVRISADVGFEMLVANIGNIVTAFFVGEVFRIQQFAEFGKTLGCDVGHNCSSCYISCI